jgi:hypothetical protein
MFSRVVLWMPVVVVVVTTAIYAWLMAGAPGRVYVAGTPADRPDREIAYPGRERLDTVDPMGVKPWLTAPLPAAEAALPPDGYGRR